MKPPLIPILLFVLLCWSCTMNTEVLPTKPRPKVGVNLIANPGFQVNGTPSLQGWDAPYPSVVEFSDDIPPVLPTGLRNNVNTIVFHVTPPVLNGPSNNWIFYSFIFPEGKYKLRFSLWSKYTRKPSVVSIVNMTDLSYPFAFFVPDTAWTLYSDTCTLTISSRDSLVLCLGGLQALVECPDPGSINYYNSPCLEILQDSVYSQ
jgi:hypothetical protein